MLLDRGAKHGLGGTGLVEYSMEEAREFPFNDGKAANETGRRRRLTCFGNDVLS